MATPIGKNRSALRSVAVTTRWILGFILVSVIALAGAYGYLRTGLPDINKTKTVAGLSHPVEIRRDAKSLVTIRAETRADAAFGLGYAHAQDRMWQMEMMRRLGAGRLSEAFGEVTLKIDRFIRVLGLYDLAEKSLPHLDPGTLGILDAYAAGVNAWIKHRSDATIKAWPPEFYVAWLEPEPWRPADSLVWGRIMALLLSGSWRDDLLRAQVHEKLGPSAVAVLWPDPDTTVPLTLSAKVPAALASRLAQAFPPELSSFSASNEWVVNGQRTATNKPILANDPHLGLTAPSTWYMARIETPQGISAGATAPGVPMVVLGHNGAAAWGFTTPGNDTQDLVIETLDPDNAERYVTENGPEAFEVREEVIKVSGGSDEVLKVRSSRHGPILSDIAFDGAPAGGEDRAVALAWTALRDDDRTFDAVMLLNGARTLDDFAEAMSLFHSPQQNIVFATKDGDIAFYSPGRLPNRRPGFDGRFPAPGERGPAWIGDIPYELLPQARNPASGAIVNANNRIESAAPIKPGGEPPYRAERIATMLRENGSAGIDDMVQIQMDARSNDADALLPLLLETETRSPAGERALAILKSWDRHMARDAAAPLIYAAWVAELGPALWADELGSLSRAYGGLARPLVLRTILATEQDWCDDRTTEETESCGDVLSSTLERALTALSGRFGPDLDSWRWSAAHLAVFRHRELDQIGWIAPLVSPVIESDGGDFTVNRGQTGGGRLSDSDETRNPFAHVHGAAFRGAYDLSDLDNSRFTMAPGQSGHMLSPHYADLMESWRDGAAFRLDGQAPAVGIVTLQPVAED
ncbi:MAG: penicillin acylase family protein [Alphaproteobacteria bacterium]|nr:penicillin acylase family protein [Alphaproteobacteria bacterium]